MEYICILIVYNIMIYHKNIKSYLGTYNITSNLFKNNSY